MNVLLFQAPVATLSPHSRLSPPLGLAYVAAHLIEDGHDVELIDLNISGLNPRRVALALKRVDPGLVGISAHTETHPNALRLAKLVKEHDASIPVVIGGPHASILPRETLGEPGVDFVSIGEGERTVVELAAALEKREDAHAIEAIAGLGHKTTGEITVNPTRGPLAPGDVRRPARHLLSLDFYEDAFNVLTARGGCPYRCPFCSASYLWGGRRRPRPVEDIMAEVEDMAATYGAQHVFFVDDIFTLNKNWVGELMGLLDSRPAGMTWGCATRVDLVDEDLLRRMAEVGCTGIQFGIESGAQEILDSVKSIDKEDALSAVRWATAAGISATCSFMIPFPEDTEETLVDTLEFMGRIKDAGGKLLMSYTTPYPGTAFFEQADELGLEILETDWERYDAKQLVMRTKHLSRERIEEIANDMAAGLGMERSA